jgi:hypothetical protein
MEEVLAPFKAAVGAILTKFGEFTDNHIFLVITLTLLRAAPPPVAKHTPMLCTRCAPCLVTRTLWP